jgi:hypothetical protein
VARTALFPDRPNPRRETGLAPAAPRQHARRHALAGPLTQETTVKLSGGGLSNVRSIASFPPFDNRGGWAEYRGQAKYSDTHWHLRLALQALGRRFYPERCPADKMFSWYTREFHTVADFTYLRFHGSGTRYGGNYPDAVLRHWAERIRSWQPQLKEVFVYFNNDMGGHAIRNARSLCHMLSPASQPPASAAQSHQSR